MRKTCLYACSFVIGKHAVLWQSWRKKVAMRLRRFARNDRELSLRGALATKQSRCVLILGTVHSPSR